MYSLLFKSPSEIIPNLISGVKFPFSYWAMWTSLLLPSQVMFKQKVDATSERGMYVESLIICGATSRGVL